MSEQADQEQSSEESGKLTLLYDKLAVKAKEAFSESSDKTVAALEAAIEKSRHHLEQAGELSRQEGQKLKAYLRRDLEQAASRLTQLKSQARDQVEPVLHKAEEGFMHLTHHLAHNASDAFARLADWADSTAVYHTGQITSPGVLRCVACNKEMNFKKTGNIPPCPSCHKTDFVKGH